LRALDKNYATIDQCRFEGGYLNALDIDLSDVPIADFVFVASGNDGRDT
jgi:hypothetical protein